MKDKTKKILLAVGGIGAGVVVASTGGAVLSMALLGIAARTGAFNPVAEVSKKTIKALFSSRYIVANLVRGFVCTGVGTKVGYDSAKRLGETLAQDEKIES